jgi:hypothetical protein
MIKNVAKALFRSWQRLPAQGWQLQMCPSISALDVVPITKRTYIYNAYRNFPCKTRQLALFVIKPTVAKPIKIGNRYYFLVACHPRRFLGQLLQHIETRAPVGTQYMVKLQAPIVVLTRARKHNHTCLRSASRRC